MSVLRDIRKVQHEYIKTINLDNQVETLKAMQHLEGKLVHTESYNALKAILPKEAHQTLYDLMDTIQCREQSIGFRQGLKAAERMLVSKPGEEVEILRLKRIVSASGKTITDLQQQITDLQQQIEVLKEAVQKTIIVRSAPVSVSVVPPPRPTGKDELPTDVPMAIKDKARAIEGRLCRVGGSSTKGDLKAVVGEVYFSDALKHLRLSNRVRVIGNTVSLQTREVQR